MCICKSIIIGIILVKKKREKKVGMGFWKKIAGILGLSGKEESHHEEDVVEEIEPPHHQFHPQFISRKGFSQVAVDRPPVGPLLLPTLSGDGGVQVFSVSSFSPHHHHYYYSLFHFLSD